jgi:hypothetical protein
VAGRHQDVDVVVRALSGFVVEQVRQPGALEEQGVDLCPGEGIEELCRGRIELSRQLGVAAGSNTGGELLEDPPAASGRSGFQPAP